MANVKKKSTRIIGAHRLIGDSLRFMRTHWKQLFGVLAVAAAVNLAMTLALNSEVASLYQSVWFVLVSCALIWTIRHLEDKKVKVSIGQAYYTGTAPALRFFLTLVVVGLASLPFSIGGFVYSAVAAAASGAGAIEKSIAAVFWLALALITLVLIARLAFSLLIVTLPDVRPIQALKLSWGLARGKTNAMVVRLAIFAFYLGAVMIAVILGFSYLPLAVGLSSIILGVLAMMLVLPLVYIYLYQLYHAVK